MKCPNCGSDDIISKTETTTITEEKVKGFGFIKACIGWLLFSLPGVLCGLCGMGKGKTATTITAKVVHVCQDCGRRF